MGVFGIMKPNRERESYCKYCGKYIGMVDYDYVCPICEEDHCDSKECYDKHHKECEKPYAEWIKERDNEN